MSCLLKLIRVLNPVIHHATERANISNFMVFFMYSDFKNLDLSVLQDCRSGDYMPAYTSLFL
ncbi:hypothetical protein RchiOBHm_Chr1g0342731 [Rosa chinensis]|uniref:Uncharacterized protein n=1 Tax=Rosa chinensis TaxID=74649 RepID=A0A2P6SE42_ROSCH|nr:hypothetical protein RchiOBHm_Chr1g0342731 [Rosa chinensis]